MPIPNTLSQAYDLKDEILSLRNAFRGIPEKSFEELETARLACENLRTWGFEVMSVRDSTSIVGTVGEGTSVCLFATMDAVPLNGSGCPLSLCADDLEIFTHACGHDANMACVLAASRIVARRLRSRTQGQLKVILQSGSEIYGDVESEEYLKVIDSGVLEGGKAVIGLHVDSTVRTGNALVVNSLTDGSEGIVSLLYEKAVEMLGRDKVNFTSRSTYVHCFELYESLLPGAMIYLGVGLPGDGSSHHASDFRIDVSALYRGTAILADTVLAILRVEPKLVV